MREHDALWLVLRRDRDEGAAGAWSVVVARPGSSAAPAPPCTGPAAAAAAEPSSSQHGTWGGEAAVTLKPAAACFVGTEAGASAWVECDWPRHRLAKRLQELMGVASV